MKATQLVPLGQKFVTDICHLKMLIHEVARNREEYCNAAIATAVSRGSCFEMGDSSKMKPSKNQISTFVLVQRRLTMVPRI
jgi:hypothetical protein